MNFFNIIKKGTNKQLEALKSSAIYEKAAEKLEPKPYAQQAKPLYLLSKYFSVAYHLLSYSIALIGITLYALQLDSVIYQIILILLAFILLAVIEIAKTNSSNAVFASKARQEQPNQLFFIVLVITTFFSFVTSVWSAKEAVYFASTNSKMISTDSLRSSQIDSVNTLYSTQISSLESSIKASQNTLNTTKTNWKINVAQKDLKESQNRLLTVLDSKEKALQIIESQSNEVNSQTNQKGLFIAKLAAVIFLIFEVLNLVSYWFLYQYYQSCLLESSIRDTNTGTGAFTSVTAGVTSAVQQAAETLKNPIPNLNYTTAVTSAVKPNSNRIGFEYGKLEESEESKEKELKDGNRICLHCKDPYTYKVHNQKFCSSECRIDFWQKKNNKKLHFKKS